MAKIYHRCTAKQKRAPLSTTESQRFVVPAERCLAPHNCGKKVNFYIIIIKNLWTFSPHSVLPRDRFVFHPRQGEGKRRKNSLRFLLFLVAAKKKSFARTRGSPYPDTKLVVDGVVVVGRVSEKSGKKKKKKMIINKTRRTEPSWGKAFPRKNRIILCR